MDMRHSITPIVLALIGMVIIGSVLIPFLLDLTDEADIEPGDTWTYTPKTNIDGATFTYSGTLLDHSSYTISGDTIAITFTDEGVYTLIITATTTEPYQTAEQTITIEVGDYGKYHDYKPLLLVVPIMFFVGLMLLVLGRTRTDDGFGPDMGGGFDGGDIAGRFGRGFGRR